MAASILLCAMRSIVESMLRSVFENISVGIPGNILGVDLDALRELTREHRVQQAQSV